MKPHHSGPELADHIGELRVKGRAPASFRNPAHVENKLRVIGSEPCSPGRFALGAGDWLCVAKEVNVEWLVRAPV
jgi:hypothetical protein